MRTRNIFYSPPLLEAIEMAVRIHGKMKRKGDNKPYIIHPIGVLALLVHWDADEETCIAGLLHDVIEDVDSDEEKAEVREEIKERYGEKVLVFVEGVTEQDKSLPWKERKKLYLAHLKEAPKESLLISCADRTHNVASLVAAYKQDGEEVWKRFSAPKEWSVWFIDQVVTTLNERLDEKYTSEIRPHLDELNRLLSQYLPEEYRSTSYDVTDKNGKVTVIIDPLFLELKDHCMLTEEELETGILDESRGKEG